MLNKAAINEVVAGWPASERKQFGGMMQALIEQQPYRVFIPNKAQAEFARVVGTQYQNTRIFLATSGNGVGKTTIAANILTNIIYPKTNIWRNIEDVETGEKYGGFFDYPLYRQWPEGWPKLAWVISNNESIKSVIKKITAWFPDGTYHESKEGKNHIAKITFDHCDWIIAFKTIDQDIKTFESDDVGLIIMDEPSPLTIFKACISRLRNGGMILIPATPLFEAAWFVDEIIERIGEDGDKYHQTVAVWANVIETGGHWMLGKYGIHPAGNLKQENVEFQLRNYDPDELEARRDGVFKYLSGLVYKSYSKETHFQQLPPSEHPEKYMYRMIIDPHDRKPPAVIWIRYDRFGRRTVVREWPSIHDTQYGGLPFHKIKDAGPYTIEDFCRFWIQVEKDLHIQPERIQRVIDPNFGRKINRSTGLMVFQEYAAASRKVDKDRGFSFITDATDDLFTGHKAVKALLKPEANGDLPLVIDSSCFNVDYAFRHYSYDDYSAKEEERHGLKEGRKTGAQQHVKQYAKDFVDLIRYDAMVPFTWQRYQAQEEGWEDYGDKPKSKRSWRQRVGRPEGSEGV